MKKSLKYLPTLVTLCLLCASQVSAGTYCTHVGASTVKCAGHVDCSTVTLKGGRYLLGDCSAGAEICDNVAGKCCKKIVVGYADRNTKERGS